MNISILDRFLGVPVLMFHGLFEQTPDYAQFPGGRSCLLSVDDFTSVIDWCVKNFNILRIRDLEKHFTTRSRKRPSLILTFDDGLASVIDLAVPILKNYGISAVVFVTTDWVDASKTPDIFALERAIWESVPANISIDVRESRLELTISSKSQIPDALTQLWHYLFEERFPPLSLSADRIQFDGKQWNREAMQDVRHFWFPANWAELRNAAQSGTIEIGSHMVSHEPLTWLSFEERLFQMERSKDLLENKTGVQVISCSYPHGLVDDDVTNLSEQQYRWGFTNRAGRVGRFTPHSAVPRFHVPSESPRQIIENVRWGQLAIKSRQLVSTFSDYF